MQPAVGLQAKAQRFGNIDATSVFYLLTKSVQAFIKYEVQKSRLFKGPDPSGPRYDDLPPFIRYWRLVLKYFGY